MVDVWGASAPESVPCPPDAHAAPVTVSSAAQAEDRRMLRFRTESSGRKPFPDEFEVGVQATLRNRSVKRMSGMSRPAQAIRNADGNEDSPMGTKTYSEANKTDRPVAGGSFAP